uniref:Pancreatic trypsin inhibitor n=1 Tax=Rhipicephalus zambeziensis TaxID=60191 RepID=A0A224Y269_9ACAR
MVQVNGRFCTFLATSLALYATTYAHDTNKNNFFNSRECSTPLMEEVRFCGNLRIWRYFFNKTSRQCEKFMWDNCLDDGVHKTRGACARRCNPNEDPGICADHPAGTCKTYPATSDYYPRKSFFYNITSRKCEEYQVCMSLGYILQQNSFPSKTLCIMHCRGLPIRRPSDKAE